MNMHAPQMEETLKDLNEESQKSDAPRELPPIEEVAAKQQSDRLVFKAGQLVPLNGVWFAVERVDKDGLFLKAVGFTKNRGRK
jgi:hypothetical protein